MKINIVSLVHYLILPISLISFVVGTGMIFEYIRETSIMANLKQNGLVTQASVVSLQRRGRDLYLVSYGFIPLNGLTQIIIPEERINGTLYRRLSTGNLTDVIYFADNPNFSRLVGNTDVDPFLFGGGIFVIIVVAMLWVIRTRRMQKPAK